jgi:PAS domain S-box-containing protein
MTVLSPTPASTSDPSLSRIPGIASAPPDVRPSIGRLEGWMGYAFAIVLVLAALGLRVGVHYTLADRIPYLPFVVAAVLSSWLCGLGPSLLVLVATIVIQAVFAFLPGENPIEQVADLIALGLFVAAGLAIVLISDSRQRAHELAGVHLGRLHEQTARLETEVSRRRAMEDDLRASELRFRTLAEAVPPIVWKAGRDGEVNYFNQRWFDATGLSPDESMGAGWSAAMHPDDLERTLATWSHSIRTGQTYEAEHRLRLRDGSYHWFLGRAVAARDLDGSLTDWFGSLTDIHDLKSARDRLAHSEGRFRTLAESLPQIVFTTTADGQLDYCNARWYDYTGLDFGRTRGRGFVAAIHPDDRETTDEAWSEAARAGRLFESEYRLRRKDGVDRWHLARALPIRDDSGVIQLWIGSITDIDDARRYTEILERTVRSRTELLERSNRELEQFAYVASHDLQEPLRKIQAFSDRLARRHREQLGDDGVESLDRILASASRMRSLINDLLSFSRVSTKTLPFTEVNLSVVAREVLVDLEERIAETQAEVDVHDLPTIQADPLQMRQLLQNLIGNALKFRKPGEPARVCVSAQTDDAQCVLSVEDHGIGFEPEYADRIFQVFQRLHGRGQFEGTGVGLAISKKIVERHGGSIEAIGRLGDGATFVVRLPIVQDHPTPSDA